MSVSKIKKETKLKKNSPFRQLRNFPCIVLYCIALCIALHCIVLHCIALYRIVLYCIVLYCIFCFLTYCSNSAEIKFYSFAHLANLSISVNSGFRTTPLAENIPPLSIKRGYRWIFQYLKEANHDSFSCVIKFLSVNQITVFFLVSQGSVVTSRMRQIYFQITRKIVQCKLHVFEGEKQSRNRSEQLSIV